MIGETLSHFRVLEKVGEGGMGVVYRAEDVELQRSVALKVLRPEFVGNERRRERFLREARTAAGISHPNLAVVHEIGEARGETFIAMEYIQGRTLRSVVGGTPLPLDVALRLALQVADGLAAAHRSQVIHRDLKPENVMIDEDERVKILDFGLAKPLLPMSGDSGDDEDHSDDETVSGFLTQEGRILGTVAYMSPEQARGRDVDPRSDIFSFGITLYEMLTGRAPFQGDTPTDTLVMILREDPEPLGEVNPAVPPEVAGLIQKCLEKEREDRYQSAEEVMREIRRLLQLSSGSDEAMIGLPPEATRASTPSGPIPSSIAPASGSGSGGVPFAGDPGGSRRWLTWLVPALVIAAATLFVPLLLDRTPLPPPVPIANSIAVMPIQNLKDPDDPERLGQILQELIITDLSEVTSLKVFSSQRLLDLQKQMGGGDHVDAGLERASRIAELAGADKLLEGTLSQLGENWILTAQLIDVELGTVLRSQRIDGSDLYGMVDQLTERLQGELQVAMAPEPESVSVREKTTSSLEAYRLYLVGLDLLNSGSNAAAADTLEVAIELDPSFGLAYYKRAMALWWAGGVLKGDSTTLAPLDRILSEELYASEQERMMAEAARELLRENYTESAALYERVTQEFPDEKEGWYGLGEALFHAETAPESEARDAFEHAIALDPSFTLAYGHIFDIYGRHGDHAEAIERIKRFIELEPENPLGYRWWAVNAAHAGDLDELEMAMLEARSHHRTPAELRMLLLACGGAHMQRGDQNRARPLFEEAWSLVHGDFDEAAYGNLLKALLAEHDLDAVEALAEELEQLHPDREKEIRSTRFSLLLAREKFPEALEQAEAALAEEASLSNYLRLARVRVRAGQVEEAESVRESVRESELATREKLQFLASIGEELFEAREFGRSADWLQESMDLGGEAERRQVAVHLALAQMRLEDFDRAESLIDHFSTAGRAPEIQEHILRMALAMTKRDLPEVERMGRECLDAGHSHEAFHVLLASALNAVERYDEAVAPAREALAMNGSYTNHVNLAWTLIAGDIDVAEGVALARAALEIPIHRGERPWILPDSPSAEHCLGLAQFKRGEIEKAVATLEKAARLRPDRTRIQRDIELARRSL